MSWQQASIEKRGHYIVFIGRKSLHFNICKAKRGVVAL